jgi:hypothetical protein
MVAPQGSIGKLDAGGAEQPQPGRGEGGGEHRLVDVDGAQGVLAVGGEGEERPGVVRVFRVGLEDLGADSGLSKRDRGGGAGDAAAGY